MNETFTLAVGLLLLGVLAIFVLRAALTARALEKEPEDICDESEGLAACPAEVVESIFSERDDEFIRGFRSRKLRTYFQSERRTVALLWVRQTASGIRRIIKEHAAATRRSADLHVMTEVRVFAQYSGLMLICGALLVTIPLVGPRWVGGLAGYAQKLSRSIAEAQQSFAASLDERAARAQGF